MMKDTDVIILFVFGFGLFIFLVVFVLSIRILTVKRFQRKCRAVGLRPSPQDPYACVGRWQEAPVVVERCGTNYCNTIYVYMELGDLPTAAQHNLGYFMQGLQTNYYTVERCEENRELNKIVAGSWRGLYLYSANLPLNATPFHIKHLCETLYQIRTELRRRVFSVRHSG